MEYITVMCEGCTWWNEGRDKDVIETPLYVEKPKSRTIKNENKYTYIFIFLFIFHFWEDILYTKYPIGS